MGKCYAKHVSNMEYHWSLAGVGRMHATLPYIVELYPQTVEFILIRRGMRSKKLRNYEMMWFSLVNVENICICTCTCTCICICICIYDGWHFLQNVNNKGHFVYKTPRMYTSYGKLYKHVYTIFDTSNHEFTVTFSIINRMIYFWNITFDSSSLDKIAATLQSIFWCIFGKWKVLYFY